MKLFKILLNWICFLTFPFWGGLIVFVVMIFEFLLKGRKSMSVNWMLGRDWFLDLNVK